MPHAFLPLEAVLAMVPTARELGVSIQARGPGGFVEAYTEAGSPDKLPERWHEIREAFIMRHEAQAKRRGESWWNHNQPTRRHLSLIMWAYSPTSQRLMRLISRFRRPATRHLQPERE